MEVPIHAALKGAILLRTISQLCNVRVSVRDKEGRFLSHLESFKKPSTLVNLEVYDRQQTARRIM